MALAWFSLIQSPLSAGDALIGGFAAPPRDARPETWFHLIGGNVAKPGLTADLEAVAGAGIEGIQLFHGNGRKWPGTKTPITCLSPAWDGMIGHVADGCGRLNLRFTMQNCPGWAMSGGPWITPDKAMRHLIWSRSEVSGGNAVSLDLAKPQPSKERWRDYRDIAVIAFPTPDGDAVYLKPAEVRSNRDEIPWTDLIEGKPGVSVTIDSKKKEATWLEVTFADPVVLRSLVLPPVELLAKRRNFDPGATIHVEAKTGSGWTEVGNRKVPRGTWQDRAHDARPLVLALSDAKASTYRITFHNKTPLELTDLRFSSAAHVNDWQGQAGYVLRSLERGQEPVQNPDAWVAADSIIDISEHVDDRGKLTWSAPAGTWTVLRFGHVNTGVKNKPAPPEATGFECDKFSTAGADQHFAGYIGRLSAPGGPADGGRLQGMVIDSWECYTQSWTPAMEQEFAGRRGYALRDWLPALAGYVVTDPLTSERFLRDWRATMSDLIVFNYYGRLAELGRERGMKLSFESGPGDVPTGDILQYYGQADIPMCEFWHPNDPHWGGLEAKPISVAVSAAHVYGKPRIAAEAFTNIGLTWKEHPFMLKHLADRNFAMGVTHLVFHTYTHNPSLTAVPGTSFGSRIGTPFLRGQTWWPHMPLWTEYLARCQFMLGKGKPVADVLWFLGDDLDHKPRQDAPFPNGYQFNYVNTDVLINRLTVADGLLKTPEGISWKILWIPEGQRLTPATLARLRELIRQGATVVGTAPKHNATLSGGADADVRFTMLVRELWGNAPGPKGDRKIGAGRLLWGGELDALLPQLEILPDVTGAVAANWYHRQADGSDIYFIAADRDEPLGANLGFRTQGQPEFWNPLDGTSRAVSVFHRQGAHTIVPIDLPAAGSVFVVFRPGSNKPVFTSIERDGTVLIDAADSSRTDTGKPQRVQGLQGREPVQPWVDSPFASCELLDGGKCLLAWEPGNYKFLSAGQTAATATVAGPQTAEINSPWTLSFPAGWDAPAQIELARLQPWSALPDPATRAFSGSATYACTIKLRRPAADERFLLDLGKVADIAAVTVNGNALPTLWAPPFRTDITSHVVDGANRIEIQVTNTWYNRLRFDAALPAKKRKTWAINSPEKDAPEIEAGLIGPVLLRRGKVIDLPHAN